VDDKDVRQPGTPWNLKVLEDSVEAVSTWLTNAAPLAHPGESELKEWPRVRRDSEPASGADEVAAPVLFAAGTEALPSISSTSGSTTNAWPTYSVSDSPHVPFELTN
jgi:hypothetical protein